MKIKTSELTGRALDYAVGIANGWVTYPTDSIEQGLVFHCDSETAPFGRVIRLEDYSPSTNLHQNYEILLSEKLCAGYKHQADPDYCPINDPETNCWARTTAGGYLSYGPTPLIAVCRCRVRSQLGDEVEVPDGLA